MVLPPETTCLIINEVRRFSSSGAVSVHGDSVIPVSGTVDKSLDSSDSEALGSAAEAVLIWLPCTLMRFVFGFAAMERGFDNSA